MTIASAAATAQIARPGAARAARGANADGAAWPDEYQCGESNCVDVISTLRMRVGAVSSAAARRRGGAPAFCGGLTSPQHDPMAPPATAVLLVLFALSTALGARVAIKINDDPSTASHSSYGATPAPAPSHAHAHHHSNSDEPTESPEPPALPEDHDVHCKAEILRRVSLAGGAHFTLRENDVVVGKGELRKRNVPSGALPLRILTRIHHVFSFQCTSPCSLELSVNFKPHISCRRRQGGLYRRARRESRLSRAPHRTDRARRQILADHQEGQARRIGRGHVDAAAAAHASAAAAVGTGRVALTRRTLLSTARASSGRGARAVAFQCRCLLH